MRTTATPNRMSLSWPMSMSGSTSMVPVGNSFATMRGVSPQSSSPSANSTVKRASVAMSRDSAGV